MLLCVPVIACVSVAKDTAADPTSHNLWPFELVLAAISGAVVVVPALLLGLALRWALARWQRARVRTQLIHQVIAAARRIADRKMSARLSYRVAIRRKSLRRQNIRSMTLRPL